MLTCKIEEYLHWRNADYDLLMFDLWCMVTVAPRWEDSEQVDRLMRAKPEGGGPLYAGA